MANRSGARGKIGLLKRISSKKTRTKLLIASAVIVVIGVVAYLNLDKFKNEASGMCSPVITPCSAPKVCNCGGTITAPVKRLGLNPMTYCSSGVCQTNPNPIPSQACNINFPALSAYANSVASGLNVATGNDLSPLGNATKNINLSSVPDRCKNAMPGTATYNDCQEKLQQVTSQALGWVGDQMRIRVASAFKNQTDAFGPGIPTQDHTVASAGASKEFPGTNKPFAGSLKWGVSSVKYTAVFNSSQSKVTASLQMSKCSTSEKSLSARSPFSLTGSVVFMLGNTDYRVNFSNTGDLTGSFSVKF